jgi:enoyl-CoA hydratase/carnithine racemase
MEHIRTERDGAVGVITISRRGRFNSLDVKTAQDLRKAGLGFARDESVRAVILRGEDGVFCSGADLKYIDEGGDESDLGYLQSCGTRLRGSLQTDPRVHPQHDLRDPPFSQALHRGGRWRGGGGGLRPRHGV